MDLPRQLSRVLGGVLGTLLALLAHLWRWGSLHLLRLPFPLLGSCPP